MLLGACAPSGAVVGEGDGARGTEAFEPGVFVEWNGGGGEWPAGAFLPAEWWEDLPREEAPAPPEGIILAHRPVRRGAGPGVRRPPPLLSSRPPQRLAPYGIRRTVDPKVVEQTRQLYYQRLAEAQAMYPNSSGYENHHVIPRYLAIVPEGTTFQLRTAYHKAITQEFRREWGYGRNDKPSHEQLMRILIRVYGKYPIPQLVGIEP
ncbi:MAG: hypothetical protein JXB05_10145 [Myxococcaceae bacterium]|nr:hypothetical protein [Myxococcaceae bacterium]